MRWGIDWEQSHQDRRDRPGSCPPVRLFNIFNATYNDDQKSSYTDYIELSMQSQFNKRGLR